MHSPIHKGIQIDAAVAQKIFKVNLKGDNKLHRNWFVCLLTIWERHFVFNL